MTRQPIDEKALLAKMRNRREVKDMTITKTLGFLVRIRVEGGPAKEKIVEEEIVEFLNAGLMGAYLDQLNHVPGKVLVTTGELDDGYQARTLLAHFEGGEGAIDAE